MNNFYPTYIINLKRRTDRRKHMDLQLSKAKIDQAIFFEAIDGHSLDAGGYEVADWIDPYTSKSLTSGEVGCALSHYYCWQAFMETSEPYAIILEDDVVLEPDFQDKLKSYLEEIDKTPNFDLLYLHRKPLESDEERISYHINRAKRSHWTCAYMISRSGAKKLLQTDYLFNLFPVDEYLPVMYGCNVYGYEKIFESNEKLKAFATNPSIVKLRPEAFNDSETYHSTSIIQSDQVEIIYVGSKNDSYLRLESHATFYGLKISYFNSVSDAKDYALNQSSQLIIFIWVGPNYSVIPMCGPTQIMKNYQSIGKPIGIHYEGVITAIGPRSMIDQLISGDFSKAQMEHELFLLIDPVEDQLEIDEERSRVKINNHYGCFAVGSNPLVMNRIENYTADRWNTFYGFSQKVKSLTKPSVYVTDKLELGSFLESNQEYFFYVSHKAMINDKCLDRLLSIDKKVASPLLRPLNNKFQSNFWGDLDSNGYYSKSFDYYDILERKKKGYWNVPYLKECFLIKREVFDLIPDLLHPVEGMDDDMAFCWKLRNKQIFMYVVNLDYYGYLDEKRLSERLEIQSQVPTKSITIYDFDQRDLWEAKYLDPNYYQFKNQIDQLDINEPCENIYHYPLFSEEFCRELIARMNSYGKWSEGKNSHNDKRFGSSYYENVPTQDIQLYEIGFDKIWSTIIKDYVAPVASRCYSSYKTKGVHMGFVVRYKWDHQPELKPHHDASVYTINIALNRAGIDYEGGGCRFIRQNYVMKNQPVGTAVMHPGRLTCYHEGLKTTKGIRFILVSFIE